MPYLSSVFISFENFLNAPAKFEFWCTPEKGTYCKATLGTRYVTGESLLKNGDRHDWRTGMRLSAKRAFRKVIGGYKYDHLFRLWMFMNDPMMTSGTYREFGEVKVSSLSFEPASDINRSISENIMA